MAKERNILGILFLIFIFFVLFIFVGIYTFNVSFKVPKSEREGKIAVVQVEGVIMDSRKIIELIQRAERDKECGAILMRINSPGGAVGPTQEIYHEIRRIEEDYTSSMGKKGKPVYSSFGSVAASGGYYIGAATRKIFTNGGTITGSLGVVMEFVNLSELFKWLKMDFETIKAGRYKDIGSSQRPLKPKERSMLKATVEVVRKQFIEDVMAVRGKKIKGDIEEISQGQIFSGQEALKFGLVDELGGLYAAGRSIHGELDFPGEFSFKFIKEKKKINFLEFIDSLEDVLTRLTDMESLFWRYFFSSRIPILMFRLQ